MTSPTVKIPMPDGKLVEAKEVPIKRSTEAWSEYELEDGTKIKAKIVVGLFARVEGQFDQDGNPQYLLRGNPTMMIVDVPEDLRKK